LFAKQQLELLTPSASLQSGKAQCERCKQRVQQGNDTEKHNIQDQLDSHDQQRQSGRQRVQEDQQPSKSQNGNSGGNSSEDLDDDESKQCADSDELTLLLGLRRNVGVLRVKVDVDI
jgi:hypothetical protein